MNISVQYEIFAQAVVNIVNARLNSKVVEPWSITQVIWLTVRSIITNTHLSARYNLRLTCLWPVIYVV